MLLKLQCLARRWILWICSILCVFSLAGCRESFETDTYSRKPWGVYQILWNPYQFETELNAQIELLGASPTYVLFFRDLNHKRSFPQRIVALCKSKGITPVISYELAPWGSPQNFDGLGQILAGKFDDYFRKWALAAKAADHPIIMRFGFEMNGDWFSWGQQPEKFKAAWQHAHQFFVEAEAENVQWLFAPNVVWGKPDPKKQPEAYYPGDAYVDLVGLDGYNFGDHHSEYHQWQSYSTTFETSLKIMEQFDKPLLLSEIGCADDARKAAWMHDFLKKVSNDSRISGFIYYNFYPKKRGEPNWRLDSDATTLKVFKQWASQ